MMAKKKSQRVYRPVSVGPNDWFYEMPGHLILVHEVRDLKTGDYIRTDQIKIHWRKIKTKLPRKK